MPTLSAQETRAVKDFAWRLIRIFERNQRLECCTCGLTDGHLPNCPQHAWEAAQDLTRMEAEELE